MIMIIKNIPIVLSMLISVHIIQSFEAPHIPAQVSDPQRQTPWSVLNIRGYSIDPATGKVDDTEGFGAFDSIMKELKPECPRNLDNGGGAYDDTSRYVKEKYNIQNLVYDPFMRSSEQNEKVLQQVQKNPTDCCTSISVLNVIDSIEDRLAHIRLCHDKLKPGGQAFFKVWPGDGSGISLKEKGRFQSNQGASYYMQDVEKVFGKGNVFLIDNKTIKAIKKNS